MMLLLLLCRSIFPGRAYKELPQERPQGVLILAVVFCREDLVLSLAGDVEVALRPVSTPANASTRRPIITFFIVRGEADRSWRRTCPC